VPTVGDRVCRVISATDPHGRILGFLDRSRYYFFQVASHLYSRGWVQHVPDSLLLRKSASAGNRTRELWICRHELWPLDHRGVICNMKYPSYLNFTRHPSPIPYLPPFLSDPCWHVVVIIVLLLLALQPFVGPWSLFHFLNPIHSRKDSLVRGSARHNVLGCDTLVWQIGTDFSRQPLHDCAQVAK
jgi:hypothetical protein